MRNLLLQFLLFSIVFYSSCQTEQEVLRENCQNAMTLAIEKNMKYRRFSKDWCSLIYSVKSSVFLLPLNKELIDAAVELKSSEENIDFKGQTELRRKNYDLFLNSDKTAFILIIINNKLNPNESVTIPDLRTNVTLKTEDGQVFQVSDFTPSLGVKLNPGWNSGYIYFKGKVPESLNSYSVHFEQIMLTCGDDSDSYTCAFAFDQTELNFLALLQAGMSKEEVQRKFLISSYSESGLSESDIANIVSLLLQTISKLL